MSTFDARKEADHLFDDVLLVAVDEIGRCDAAAALERAYAAGLAAQSAGTAVPVAHVCKCSNGPCPVCGGGPSGEWSEGDDVKCDDCGTALYVSRAEECLGRSAFDVAEVDCDVCEGNGRIDYEDATNDGDCPKCAGEGTRTPTVSELRAKLGLPASPPLPPGGAAAAYVGVDLGGESRTVHSCTDCEWFIDTTAMSEAQVTDAVHAHLKADHQPAEPPGPLPPREPVPAPMDDECCNATAPFGAGQAICTLIPGHDGDHVAHGGEEPDFVVMHRWFRGPAGAPATTKEG